MDTNDTSAPESAQPNQAIKKYGRRYWAVYDDRGELVCVTVYKKGAREVARLLAVVKINCRESAGGAS